MRLNDLICSGVALASRRNPLPSAIVGALRPPKIFGQIVKCNSSTRPAWNKAAFSSPPPSQSRRLIPHFARNQRSAARRSILFFPPTFTSSAMARSWRNLAGAARRVVSTMMGEKRCLKTSARGLTKPLPLTMTRKLCAANPRFNRNRRNFAGPGPRLIGADATVRAPAMTASAVARNSNRCSWSRALPKDETIRFIVAILPSAVIAMFTSTNGNLDL